MSAEQREDRKARREWARTEQATVGRMFCLMMHAVQDGRFERAAHLHNECLWMPRPGFWPNERTGT